MNSTRDDCKETLVTCTLMLMEEMVPREWRSADQRTTDRGPLHVLLDITTSTVMVT